MSRVEALEKSVRALSDEELAAFRAWFVSFDAEAWDRQIEEDLQAGKLDAIAEEAVAEYRRGESREL
jgi:hypothetical protein